MRFDEIILDLKILSNIQKGGKVCSTADGHIALETRENFQGIRRLVTGDSRRRAVEKVNGIVNNAFDKANDLLRSKYMDIYEKSSVPMETEVQRHNEDIEALQALAVEFNSAVTGLENLCDTYGDDAETASKLRIAIDKVRHKADDIEMKIERYHKKHVRKQLPVMEERSEEDCPSEPEEDGV